MVRLAASVLSTFAVIGALLLSPIGYGAIATQAAEQATLDKAAKIMVIFSISKGDAIALIGFESRIKQLAVEYKRGHPDATDEQAAEFVSLCREQFSRHIEGFKNATFEAWDSVYDSDDIDAYYAFVTSPQGQHFLSKNAEAVRKSNALAKVYGEGVLMPDLIAAIKADEKLSGPH